jgi:hypothetical protein
MIIPFGNQSVIGRVSASVPAALREQKAKLSGTYPFVAKCSVR